MASARNTTKTLILAAALLAHPSASGAADAVRLKQQQPVARGVAALPRVVAGADAAGLSRINTALATDDAWVRRMATSCRQAGKKSPWDRKIETTMAGPRFVSFLARDEFMCDSAYPNDRTTAHPFDLATGRAPDWAALLPGLDLRAGTAKNQGQVWRTYSSDRLADFFRAALKGDDGPTEANNGDQGCVGAVDGEPDLKFILWLDAKTAGIGIEASGFPHVIRACAAAPPIPIEKLRPLGAKAELVEALLAARAGAAK